MQLSDVVPITGTCFSSDNIAPADGCVTGRDWEQCTLYCCQPSRRFGSGSWLTRKTAQNLLFLPILWHPTAALNTGHNRAICNLLVCPTPTSLNLRLPFRSDRCGKLYRAQETCLAHTPLQISNKTYFKGCGEKENTEIWPKKALTDAPRLWN
jgi:hypothetical protein